MDQVEYLEKDFAPDFSQEDLDRVVAYLRGKGWVPRHQIEADLGMNERRVRLVAEHSDGEILSGPGTPGYKLFTRSTTYADVDLCTRTIESQIKRMMTRLSSIRRRHHRYGISAPAEPTNAP
jgi:hypothetical protein